MSWAKEKEDVTRERKHRHELLFTDEPPQRGIFAMDRNDRIALGFKACVCTCVCLCTEGVSASVW